MTDCRRINMWSDPRNISTAMLYAWRQRSDTAVWDEPMYGHYLVETGIDHPDRDLVLASVPTDAGDIFYRMTEAPCPAPGYFFKNMAHHLFGFDWSVGGHPDNFLLTRNPKDQLRSLAEGLGRLPTMQDAAYDVQVRLIDHMVEAGHAPIVVDSRELLVDPRSVLTQLCTRLGIPFEVAMLKWPAGPKPEDGVWGQHWYERVHRSTGFDPHRAGSEQFPDELVEIYEKCAPLYGQLMEFAIRT